MGGGEDDQRNVRGEGGRTAMSGEVKTGRMARSGPPGYYPVITLAGCNYDLRR